MATEILMPALSPTMEEGTLAKWLVKEGDSVSSGDIIAEIETDKATMEFESVDEGIIGKILVNEGRENVQVNTPIAVLVEAGESLKALPAAANAPTEIASSPQAFASAPVAASVTLVPASDLGSTAAELDWPVHLVIGSYTGDPEPMEAQYPPCCFSSNVPPS